MSEPAIPDNVLAAAALRTIVDHLHASLDRWSERDDTKAQPGVRQAANDAVTAIDAMLGQLHKIRAELVTEIRCADDATAAQVDAFLAALRAERGEA